MAADAAGRMTNSARVVRGLLAGVVSLAVLIAAGYIGAALLHTGPAPLSAAGTKPTPTAAVNPIVAENQHAGTTDWRIKDVAASRGIEGYADHVSAHIGDTVNLSVSTAAARYRVQAFRMGYYGGLGGRLIWQSPLQRGGLQVTPTVQAPTFIVEASWKPTTTIHVDAAWPPGDYLLKLAGDGGQQRYVPLTVVDDTSTADLVIQNAVTTWQAYNNWGGYNLYNGPDQTFASRSRIVSFDRPYAGDGSGDFLGNEFPLVYFAESYGLDVTYWTDIDLHERGAQLLGNHRGLITLGHDEYWTRPMRAAATDGRDRGVNLAFLGANAVFRQIRLDASPLGSDRRVVDYKDAGEDPLDASAKGLVTVNWRDAPVNLPESSLIGQSFECNPAKANAVVVDATSWLFENTGVHDGDTLTGIVGPWYDRVNLAYPTPPNLEVLMHSPVSCPTLGPSYSDMTYYAATSGAGVFSTGTTTWVCELTASCLQDPRPHPDLTVLQVTRNVLLAFGAGPAGQTHPSKPNVAALHIDNPKK
jgi:hypothetical protein